MALDNSTKKKILKSKLKAYEQQYYSLQLELEVAEDVGSERIADQVKEDMVKVKKSLRYLEKKLAGLEKDGE